MVRFSSPQKNGVTTILNQYSIELINQLNLDGGFQTYKRQPRYRIALFNYAGIKWTIELKDSNKHFQNNFKNTWK